MLLPHATTFIIPHELNLTEVLLLRFYGAGVACIAIISLLCRDMPNMLPCKRGAGKLIINIDRHMDQKHLIFFLHNF